jgi:hypothetical protein
MAKGQKRSTRELRKPKAGKTATVKAAPSRDAKAFSDRSPAGAAIAAKKKG